MDNVLQHAVLTHDSHIPHSPVSSLDGGCGVVQHEYSELYLTAPLLLDAEHTSNHTPGSMLQSIFLYSVPECVLPYARLLEENVWVKRHTHLKCSIDLIAFRCHLNKAAPSIKMVFFFLEVGSYVA